MSSRPSLSGLAASYFVIQGLGILAWWVTLIVMPSARAPFLGDGMRFEALAAFAPADLAVLAPASLLAALGLRRRARWAWTSATFATAAGVYAAAYSVALPIVNGGGALGALLMAPVLIVPPLLLWLRAFEMVRHGNGTPLPADCPRDLVVAGPYRHVRNPMAMGSLLQGFAVGVHVGSPLVLLYALAGLIGWDRLVRPWEELDLERRFGRPYVDYREAVRCWIPRRTAWSPLESPPTHEVVEVRAASLAGSP